MFCVVLAGETWEEIYTQIEGAKTLTHLFELRLDYLEDFAEKELTKILERNYRFICTFRSKEEGGRKSCSPEKRWEILSKSASLGAYLIDVEWKHLYLGKLKSSIKKSPFFPEKILFSYHNFQETPPLKSLKDLLRRASLEGARWFKITTLVKSFSESLNLLSLIPYGKELGIEVIAFGMGEKGKLSRILSLLSGAPFTYVFPQGGKALAPGQLDLIQAKRLYEVLTSV
ncbi:3-dehydroquinate dehydratase [Caldimicrobium thiodismutans]|uniref:3-dehydroquinate dehydratase n=1 Tax=Caldimicrobium thiodismutans TaxID=1653476 RepID=A0A0U5AZ56_9BACT|nr:type I 3-dehydroquinate dehydratase [Caldimicrobium thiodismutans]BAU23982.1 3-dehydroquinate dehydratase [Caldimicrobium thiodismutans]